MNLDPNVGDVQFGDDGSLWYRYGTAGDTWARFWTAGNGVVVHLFLKQEERTLNEGFVQRVLNAVNRADGVQNVGSVPGEDMRSKVADEMFYVTGFVELSQLSQRVRAALATVLGNENVLWAGK